MRANPHCKKKKKKRMRGMNCRTLSSNSRNRGKSHRACIRWFYFLSILRLLLFLRVPVQIHAHHKQSHDKTLKRDATSRDWVGMEEGAGGGVGWGGEGEAINGRKCREITSFRRECDCIERPGATGCCHMSQDKMQRGVKRQGHDREAGCEWRNGWPGVNGGMDGQV